MTNNSQKFIARNRAPRVQIEYDVELYGSEKKVQLPFVMGVMSDLAGKSVVPQPSIEERKFLEIDVDNFDERMKAMAPRAAFAVPNTLTGEGNLAVDLTFEKMSDFSPEAIASKVEPLKGLLEARTQLSNLMAYMDGKSGAEALIERLLADPGALAAITSLEPSSDADAGADVLQALADAAPEDVEDTSVADALSSLPEIEDAVEDDRSGDILSGLAEAAPEEVAEEDASAEVLQGLADVVVEDVEDTSVADALSSIPEVEVSVEDDTSGDILSGLAEAAPEDVAEEDASAEVLQGLADVVVEDVEDTSVADALSSIPEVEVEAEQDTGQLEDVLGDLAQVEIAEDESDQLDDVLSSLPEVEETEDVDDSADILGGLADQETGEDADEGSAVDDALASIGEIEDVVDADDSDDILSGLADIEIAEEEDDSVAEALASLPDEVEQVEDTSHADILENLAESEIPDAEGEDVLSDVLGTLPEVEDNEAADSSADVLQGLADIEVETADAEQDTDDVLSALPEVAEEADADEGSDDILAGLTDIELTDESTDDLDDVLSGLADIEDADADEDDSGDILNALADSDIEDSDVEDSEDDDLGDVLAGLAEAVSEDGEQEDVADDILSDLSATESEDDAAADDLDDILSGLSDAGEEESADDDSDDILSGLAEVEVEEDASDDLDDILGGLDEPEDSEETNEMADVLGDLGVSEADEQDAGDGFDDLLSGFTDLDPSDDTEGDAAPASGDDDDLDDLLGDLDMDSLDEGDVPVASELSAEVSELESTDDALGDILGDLEAEEEDAGDVLAALSADLEAETDADEDVLADLMSDLEGDDDEEDPLAGLLDDLGDDDAEEEEQGLGDLDSVLADLDAEEEQSADAEAAPDGDDLNLDDLLGDLGGDDAGGTDVPAEDDLGLGDLLGDLEDTASEAAPTAAAHMSDEPEFAFGQMSAARPDAQALKRQRFRIALFGDFTGRSTRGVLETGEALAARAPVELDIDTVEDVIESFATTLVLPLGKDGAGIEVKLKELDDLHPDKLFEKVELFSELVSLKRQLGSGATSASAAKTLEGWAEAYGQKLSAPRKTSSSNTVRADMKLSDFQKLIGATEPLHTEASPVQDLLAQVVGPHIRALLSPDVAAMQAAVDEALSGAMRMVLHHPDFQAIEAQWRMLDLLARSVETNENLDIVLYDISAEEIAADLASADDLSQSGLARLLTEAPLDEETGRGGYSVLIGLYTFEETPPHAELLGRIARVAAHVDAPFISAITPNYLETKREDRHPLVAEAWDTLRAMPEAGHLGLASPRFMLRRPYGAKSEPIYEFDFEEFTQSEGLKGMLWANPAVLVAILMARSFKENGPGLQLGKIMSLGDIPFHYVLDRYGDQVALPCTERNLSVDKHTFTVQCGYMPVLSIKGRDEIRLGSFNSVAGAEILGPWSNVPPPPPSPPKPVAKAAPEKEEGADPGLDLDAGDGDGEIDLDALLAGFDDASDSAGDDGDMDDDLAALLNDL